VIVSSLTEPELVIVRATEPSALVDLDEDELLDLHARVRRVRNKYQGQYRRRAAARVSEAGGRGKARLENQRARDKAEVFESSLARVSTALAKAARRAAADLRAERLEAARANRGASGPGRSASALAPSEPVSAQRQPRKSAGQLKRDASDVAIGRRKQAKRDGR
jgi:hypothetical protein